MILGLGALRRVILTALATGEWLRESQERGFVADISTQEALKVTFREVRFPRAVIGRCVYSYFGPRGINEGHLKLFKPWLRKLFDPGILH